MCCSIIKLYYLKSVLTISCMCSRTVRLRIERSCWGTKPDTLVISCFVTCLPLMRICPYTSPKMKLKLTNWYKCYGTFPWPWNLTLNATHSQQPQQPLSKAWLFELATPLSLPPVGSSLVTCNALCMSTTTLLLISSQLRASTFLLPDCVLKIIRALNLCF